MKRLRVQHSGFALAFVLFALALVAALTAGAFFAGIQESRVGANAVALLRAKSAAAAAIRAAFAAWPAASLDSLPVGATSSLPAGTIGGVSYRASAHRASEELFLIAASGQDPVTGAERDLVAVARLEPLNPPVRSVLRLRGSIAPELASRVDSSDHTPTGWICPSGGADAQSISLEPGAADSTFLALGPLGWSLLTAWAAHAGPGGDSLPLGYVTGGEALDGAHRLGILLVDGDLTLEGGAQFVGILLVRGKLTFGPGGGAVFGHAAATDVNLAPGVDPALVRIGYSSCAVGRAARSRAPASPLAGGAAPAWF